MKYNIFLGLLIKEIRTRYHLTLRELAAQIDKSEIAVRKYENGDTPVPFNVLFMVVHIIGLQSLELMEYVEDVLKYIKENEIMSDDEINICFEKWRFDMGRLYRGFMYSGDLEPMVDNEDCTTQWLYNQIFEYMGRRLKHISQNSKDKVLLDVDKSDIIIKDILDYINFKIDKYYNGELNAKKEK